MTSHTTGNMTSGDKKITGKSSDFTLVLETIDIVSFFCFAGSGVGAMILKHYYRQETQNQTARKT